MKPRFATQTEIDNWDDLIINNPDGGNMFASFEFAMQKETGGYKARFAMIDDLAITIAEKSVPLLGKLWYLPKGPEVTSTSDLFKTLDVLRPFAAANNVFAIKVESELTRDNQSKIAEHGLQQVSPVIPNPSTITIDLSPNLGTIMANFDQKGRHAIRRAERDGVTVELVESTNENCQVMYDMWSATAQGRFGIRSHEYYRTFWQRFSKSGHGQMFFAYFNNQVVASAYATIYGRKSTYKDGASVRERTTYGASHLLQWYIIQWAKSKGSKLHDLCGSPPSDQINNPDHKHHGIGLFKTSFSKNIVDYIGCYDLPINQFRYKVWRLIGERIAHRLHYYKNHDSYY